MSFFIRSVLGVLLLGFAGFCVFGFLASAEAPAEVINIYRTVYAVLGAGSMLASVYLLKPRGDRGLAR